MNYKVFIKGLLFTLLLYILYTFICPYLLSSIFRNFITTDNYIINNLTLLIIYLITLIILIAFVYQDFFKDLKNFFKNPTPILNTALSCWIYGFIVMIASNLFATALTSGIATNEELVQSTLIEDPIYMIPVVVLIGPIIEEIIFRLGLKKAFTKKLPFMLFSGFIFGALHIISGFDSYSLSYLLSHLKDWLFIVPYGALGFYFAKAYYETDNIFASITPHILHNTLSVALIIISNLIK